VTILCPKCRAPNPESDQFCGECGARLARSLEPLPEMTKTVRTPFRELGRGGTFAGRYDVIEELGGGGMGKVYRVFDRKTEEEVALKLIRPDIAEDRETIDRFRNELKTARRISHRNITRMYDLGEDDGTYFITMEYVPGEDLKSFLHRSKLLSVGTAVSIAEQVCDGLEEAHRLGIVHRDLKPGNIMIDKDGNVRIMDFGIARSLAAKGRTGAGVMIGTPEYMSPEQVEGQGVDPRTDIYSVGVILFEMTTGRTPFGGDTPFSVGMKHKIEKPADPREINPQIPENLSRLILRCLEKDKERRFRTAADLRAELERIKKGLTTTEREIGAGKPLASKVITVKLPLRKVLWPGLGVVAAAAVLFWIWKAAPRRHAPPPASGRPTLAILYFENISGDKLLEPWRTGLTELLIAKLGQSRFIRVLDGNTIYGLLRRLNLQDARKYTKEDLTKVANEAGAGYTLSGSLLRAGPDVLITFSLQKPQTGEVVSPISVDCKNEGEVIARIDEVAGRIKADLDLSRDQIAADPDRSAGSITTASAEAFKCYSEGRKFHSLGDNLKCIEWMQKAVALDPEFAMAYRSMGSAYGNLGETPEQMKYYQKALEFRDRVSGRERLSIEGDYYRLSENTIELAIEAYRKLLALYPDDVIGHTNLGVLYSDLEEWDRAIECETPLVENGTGNAIALNNLAEAYQAKGQYARAEEVLEHYLSLNPDSAMIHSKLAQDYVLEGRYDAALQEIRKAIALNPEDFSYSLVKAGIHFLMDDVSSCEREARKLEQFASPTAKFAAWQTLANLAGSRGQFKKAREYAEQGLALAREIGDRGAEASILSSLAWLDQLADRRFDLALSRIDLAMSVAAQSGNAAMQRSLLRQKGIAELEKNSIPEAVRTASELKEMCEKAASKKQMRLYFELLARIELAKKNPPAAIEDARKMMTFWSAPGPSDILADAYDMAGDKKRALEDYVKINASPLVKQNDILLYLRSFIRLGELSEELGLRDKAVGYGQQFLDRFKNADPGAPYVEEVRKIVAGLRGA